MADSTNTMNDAGMSSRGWSNVSAIMPKIQGAVAEREKRDNPNIDLSTAENWLIRPELIELCKKAISTYLVAQDFSYPKGFNGDPPLIEALASFFNQYFNPHVPVLPAHIAVAPGAAASLDALLYNICDPGEGVLVPGPYWNGFDFLMKARSSVTPIAVNTTALSETLTEALVPALEAAIMDATCPVKALVFTNPHNPLGQRYPKSVLESCILFCKKHDIHFVSDEVYALTSFTSADCPEPTPFTSALSIDIAKLGFNPARIHVFWSTSKDFGQSGLRLGCSISQGNQAMAVGLALAANTQNSALTSIFVTHLLTSPELPSLISLNSTRLKEAYESLTAVLQRHKVPYIPCYAGIYVFAKIAPNASQWEDEAAKIAKMKVAGVVMSSGSAYHGPDGEKGWARISFALDPEVMKEAVRRIESVLGDENNAVS